MLIVLIAIAFVADPAIPAPPPAPAVRVITDEGSRKACQYLGLVSVRKAMGPNKAGGALKKALDKVAQMGGNGLFLLNQSQTWTDGASVTGEALRCPNNVLP